MSDTEPDAATMERFRAHEEAAWRSMVCHLWNEGHKDLVTTEAASRYSREDWGRIWTETLTPQDLAPPWTPNLVLLLDRVRRLVDHYQHWDRLGQNNTPLNPFWWPGVYEDNAMSTGEQAFALILDAYKTAGLDKDTVRSFRHDPERTEPWNWFRWIEGQRERFRRRARWLHATVPWASFQVDINHPSLFLDVTGPDVWQVIIDAFCDADDFRYRDMWHFLQNMQMASLDYIQREIPGPHHDKDRAHNPEIPLGYGTSTKMPSFGYRREHRSEQRLAGWAAAHQMDLFNPKVWSP